MTFSRISILTGHYGSGKTNLAVNIARHLSKAEGKQVVLFDLDIVNPYFRSSDFTEMLEGEGIEVCAPLYANSNLDIPALTGRLDAALRGDSRHIVIDVGGDDAGAYALGRYSEKLLSLGQYEMYYVINCYRYLTRTPEEAHGALQEVEGASRLKATALINNSNLGAETQPQVLADSMDFARRTAQAAKLPLAFSAVLEEQMEAAKALPEIQGSPLFPVQRLVKTIWEA